MRAKTPHEVLGVPKNATKDQVKRAYRRRAKETHTDRQGDAEAFKEVHAAYRVLTDDRMRERWESTGQWDDEPNNSAGKAAFVLTRVFEVVVGQLVGGHQDPTKSDVVDMMRSIIRQGQVNLQTKKRQVVKDREAWKKIAGRFKRKGGGSTPMDSVVAQKVQGFNAAEANIDDEIEANASALALLDGVSYDFDRDASPMSFLTGISTVKSTWG